LVVHNDLPVSLASLELRDPRDSKVEAALADVKIPASGQVELKLAAEQVETLAKAKKLQAVAFEAK
jgi:hypothetical protein